MNKPTHEIKDRLQKALMIKNISQQELSEKTGISKSSISQYLSGYSKPKSDRIYILAKALHVSEPWLLGYDVKMDKEIELELVDLSNYVKIPIVGTIPAGIPLTVLDIVIPTFI